jgi:outer membrane protein assembly factor BamB
MIRIGVIVAAMLVIVAGCSAGDESEEPTTTRAERARPAPEAPAPDRKRVYVSVVDGDTNRVVEDAVVRIRRMIQPVSARGVAAFGVKPSAQTVHVSAPGYSRRSLLLPFHKRRWETVRIYRPEVQWPLYGVKPTRTQAHGAIKVRPPFRQVWSRSVETLIEFPAVVSDGVAYIGNLRGSVYAISMRGGGVIWRHDIPSGKMAASPAVVGPHLVVHGMEGNVWVFDRATGRPVWRYRVGSPIESSPVVRDGVDYFGAWNGNVYALDLRARKLRWTFGAGYKITSSAALAGSTLFIGDYGGRLFALSTANGRERWRGSVNGRIYGTPAVSRGRVFVPSSTGNSMTAFTTGGRRLWSVGTGGYVYSSAAVWGGRVFFGSYSGQFYCVSARTGSVLWTVSTGGPISGAAVVVAGIAYAGSLSGEIYGVDARSGRVVVRFPHGEYVPVSGNARRLLFHGFSRLYAVESRRR